MSIFSPETILLNLIKSLGVSPADLQKALTLIMSEVSTLSIERAAFKAGAGEMVKMFVDRLNAQDERLNRIETLLVNLCAELGTTAQTEVISPKLMINGNIHHE